MLGVDHPSPDSSTPTFIIEPKKDGFAPALAVFDF